MSTPDEPRDDPTDLGVVRLEEEAHVSVRTVPYERVRIRRRVVVEQRTIEVRREELVIERIPLDDGEAGFAPDGDAVDGLGATGELELELRHEEVELVRRVVPFERVRVRRELVHRDAPVDETLRVERVEVEER